MVFPSSLYNVSIDLVFVMQLLERDLYLEVMDLIP